LIINIVTDVTAFSGRGRYGGRRKAETVARQDVVKDLKAQSGTRKSEPNMSKTE
jgi:hypothetical protein